MPKLKKRPGRKPELFGFRESWEQIATRVSNVPRPGGGFPTPEAMTKRTTVRHVQSKHRKAGVLSRKPKK
jgi:hypothetical protein